MIYCSPIITPGHEQFLIWSVDCPSPLLSILGIRLIVFYTTILGHLTLFTHIYSIMQILYIQKQHLYTKEKLNENKNEYFSRHSIDLFATSFKVFSMHRIYLIEYNVKNKINRFQA